MADKPGIVLLQQHLVPAFVREAAFCYFWIPWHRLSIWS